MAIMIFEHREFCRRQHRMLGHYLAIQAWINGLDCLVVRRNELGGFLRLKHFKGKRLEWLKADLKPWFQFVYDLYSVGSFSGVYLSRKSLPSPLCTEKMTDEKRIAALANHSIVANKLSKIPTEFDAISRPALWTAGLDIPTQTDVASK